MADWLLLWTFYSAPLAGITACSVLLVRLSHICIWSCSLDMLFLSKKKKVAVGTGTIGRIT